MQATAEFIKAGQYEQMLRESARRTLAGFIRYRFRQEQRRLDWCWYLDYLCEVLQAVHARQIRRVIINIPPRFLKSELVSQSWQAWMIGQENSSRSSVVSASYSGELAARDSRATRDMVTSAWFGHVFPGMELNKNTEKWWSTTGGASRVCAGVGGKILGEGGDHLIGDDLLSPLGADGAARDNTNEWLGSTLWSRLNDQKTGTITIIAQRLHENDPCGYLLASDKLKLENWTHISLPNEAEKRKIYSCGDFFYEREVGEFLNPKRLGKKESDRLKAKMRGNYDGQYQQRPSKQTGGFLQPGQLIKIDKPGELIQREWGLSVSLYIDPATKEKQNAKEDPDNTCITAMARDQLGRIYIVDQWAAQADAEEVCSVIIAMKKKWGAKQVKCEKGGIYNVLSVTLRLLCEIRHVHVNLIPCEFTEGDKVQKAMPLQAAVRCGQVHVPAAAPWLPAMEEEWRSFWRGAHDDRVDSPALGVLDFEHLGSSHAPPHEPGTRKEKDKAEMEAIKARIQEFRDRRDGVHEDDGQDD